MDDLFSLFDDPLVDEPAPEAQIADRLPVARVVVSVPVAIGQEIYDYLVPKKLDSKAVAGARVEVEFGASKSEGFIVERRERTSFTGELKALTKVIGRTWPLHPELTELAHAFAASAVCRLNDVLSLAVPERVARGERLALEARETHRLATGANAVSAETGADSGAGLIAGSDTDLIAGFEAGLTAGERLWSRYDGGLEFLRALEGGGAPSVAVELVEDARALKPQWCDHLVEAALKCAASGRDTVICVPTLAQAQQLEAAMRPPGEHAGAVVIAYHGDLAAGERYRRFLECRGGGRPRIVIGTRVAALVAVDNPGLFAAFDPLDSSMRSQKTPRVPTWEFLAWRARHRGAALALLGPSHTIEQADLANRGQMVALEALPEARALRPLVRSIGAQEAQSYGPSGWARLSPAVIAFIRRALTRGPVLALSARRGYLPTVACGGCFEMRTCPHCGGQITITGPQRGPTCARCSEPAPARCVNCGQSEIRVPSAGSARTREELARNLRGTEVLESSTTAEGGAIDTLDGTSRLVVATPGAEPRVAGGYAGAVVLDGGAITSRVGLEAGQEALRIFASLRRYVRPFSDGGEILLSGGPSEDIARALVSGNTLVWARRQLQDRASDYLPPVVPGWSFTGTERALAEAALILEAASLPVAGPVDYRGGRRLVALGSVESDTARLLLDVRGRYPGEFRVEKNPPDL